MALVIISLHLLTEASFLFPRLIRSDLLITNSSQALMFLIGSSFSFPLPFLLIYWTYNTREMMMAMLIPVYHQMWGSWWGLWWRLRWEEQLSSPLTLITFCSQVIIRRWFPSHITSSSCSPQVLSWRCDVRWKRGENEKNHCPSGVFEMISTHNYHLPYDSPDVDDYHQISWSLFWAFWQLNFSESHGGCPSRWFRPRQFLFLNFLYILEYVLREVHLIIFRGSVYPSYQSFESRQRFLRRQVARYVTLLIWVTHAKISSQLLIDFFKALLSGDFHRNRTETSTWSCTLLHTSLLVIVLLCHAKDHVKWPFLQKIVHPMLDHIGAEWNRLSFHLMWCNGM